VRSGGEDLTVTAVAEGRDAAEDIHATLTMADHFIGIKSPNPFWLASAPPTDKKYNVERAFEAGWGGVVWKTLGSEGPPIVNVNGPRYGAIWGADRRLLGLNNIELITDRPLEVNLREIKEVKRKWRDRAMMISLMVPCDEESWKDILMRIEDTEADGVELNFGCPHGMAERGMGSAVGQVPEYIEMVTRWVKQYSRMPCIVKLTPNVTSILPPAVAAHRGGADAVSLINTVKSITNVDLDHFSPFPMIDGKGSHGGYCGPAVKPIALNMVAEIARNPRRAACRSAASAASPPGATRRSSWRLGRATCRSARRR
jgi:dihydropyrimidine dehydrogenase (NAD+) subunit PreA